MLASLIGFVATSALPLPVHCQRIGRAMVTMLTAFMALQSLSYSIAKVISILLGS